ncbi:transglutaminase domain-containing protein [Candidatus Dojkabacteria bacterium]|nr:transglutaminase domain-containing protein [Candidatus Dojkabacteria bacterium]
MKKLLKKIIVGLLLGISVFPYVYVSPVSAAHFETSISFTYSVDQSGLMHIKEVRKIRNNAFRYYIPASSEETFIISSFKVRSETKKEDLEKVAETIVLTDGQGNSLEPEMQINDERIELKVPYREDITRGMEKTFVLEYDNFELAEKVGNIWNIYIPGMPENFDQIITSESGAQTKTSYSVVLEIEDKLGEANFVLPEPSSFVRQNGNLVYTFDSSSLVEQSAWIQIGDRQYYSFQITQKVQQSEGLSSKMFNIFYDLALPRENDLESQNVYFESITPEPDYVREDSEGNVIARFSFPKDEGTEIAVKGYIVTNVPNKINSSEVGNIEDIDLEKDYGEIENMKVLFKDLLSQAEYWEVNDVNISKKASELKGKEENVYEIILSDYNFVIESVDYDNLKTDVFNERQGALKTLEGGSSVCMEYSDLLITLLRAQGIPARAAFGYGFDPKSEGQNQEGHQWVEAYVPNVGWVPIDPTWGDTGRKNYIGGDIDHVLWRVASLNVDTPSSVTKYSILDEEDLEPPKFEIEAVEEVNLENLTPLKELLAQYNYTPRDSLTEKVDQLNIYGKILFLGVPTLLVLLILFSIFTSLVKFVKKLFSKNFVHAKPASHDVPDNPYY